MHALTSIILDVYFAKSYTLVFGDPWLGDPQTVFFAPDKISLHEPAKISCLHTYFFPS